MKTEVKKLDNNKVEINIEITGDAVKNKFEDVFKKIASEAKVPGFRPGNAPRDIIEKNFSGHAHEQVLKELIPETYDAAVKQDTLEPIDYPEISEVKLDRDSLSFKATVEVSPVIDLKNYKGIKIEYKRPQVSPEDIKRNLDALKESRKIDSLDDKFAKGLSYPDMQELEKAVERQIMLQKEDQLRQKIENKIIEETTKDLNFKVPQSLIERQIQDMLRRAKVDLAMKGMPREKIEEQEQEMAKTLRPEAEKQVKIYLVLAEIAKREKIPLDDHMPRLVMEFLLKEADWKIS